MTVDELQKEARDIATRLMEAYPGRAAPLVLMGMVCNQRGNTAEAVKYWQKSLELDPKRSDACRSIGEVAARKGQYAKALKFLRNAVEMDPTRPEPYEGLGRTLMKLGKVDQAVAALERGAKACPKANRVHLALAQAYLQAKDYDKAKKGFEAAIARKLDLIHLPKAYYGLSTACARLELGDEARRYQQKFRASKAAHRKAHLDWRRASYDEVVLKRRHLAGTCTDAGSIYIAYANRMQAERLWLKAASLDPENTDCRTKLVLLYHRDARRLEALRVCEQIRNVEPENPVNYLNIGLIRQELKRFDAAEKAFRKVIRFAPERAEGYRALAELYLQIDRKLSEARAMASRAAALQPTASNYFTLSKVCRKNGDVNGCLSALKRAIELDPDNMKYRLEYEFTKHNRSKNADPDDR